jgi:hypothetical protein
MIVLYVGDMRRPPSHNLGTMGKGPDFRELAAQHDRLPKFFNNTDIA